jgi:hypothetical protein
MKTLFPGAPGDSRVGNHTMTIPTYDDSVVLRYPWFLVPHSRSDRMYLAYSPGYQQMAFSILRCNTCPSNWCTVAAWRCGVVAPTATRYDARAAVCSRRCATSSAHCLPRTQQRPPPRDPSIDSACSSLCDSVSSHLTSPPAYCR